MFRAVHLEGHRVGTGAQYPADPLFPPPRSEFQLKNWSRQTSTAMVLELQPGLLVQIGGEERDLVDIGEPSERLLVGGVQTLEETNHISALS